MRDCKTCSVCSFTFLSVWPLCDWVCLILPSLPLSLLDRLRSEKVRVQGNQVHLRVRRRKPSRAEKGRHRGSAGNNPDCFIMVLKIKKVNVALCHRHIQSKAREDCEHSYQKNHQTHKICEFLFITLSRATCPNLLAAVKTCMPPSLNRSPTVLGAIYNLLTSCLNLLTKVFYFLTHLADFINVDSPICPDDDTLKVCRGLVHNPGWS